MPVGGWMSAAVLDLRGRPHPERPASWSGGRAGGGRSGRAGGRGRLGRELHRRRGPGGAGARRGQHGGRGTVRRLAPVPPHRTGDSGPAPTASSG
ncbi:hypothetical protein LV779_02560 [Streptomyces thinghirensis]|nr:hypothetical protein [Streptomyces thinghirensis]